MANTVYGPYTETSWSGSTGINITRLDNLETQASVALNGINSDLSGPFVYSGITCTKDGTNANQLDIASGRAYVTMSDGTTGLIVVGADNTHTTSTPSTTYYLFLKNDGTWQWSTTSTGPANSLPICHATTDGSGNINVVTDDRATTSVGAVNTPRVPVIVAAPAELHVTSTSLLNPVWSFQPNIAGLYRISGSLYKHSGGTSFVYMRTSYWGVHSGANAVSTFFITSSGVAAQPYSLQGNIGPGTTQLADGEYGLVGSSFYASTSGVIEVSYQDASGTPDDYILLAVERLR